MASYLGTIHHSDLEGGSWELHADDGTIYELDGGPDEIRRHDARVEIEGSVDRNALSLSMRGAILRVRRARLV